MSSRDPSAAADWAEDLARRINLQRDQLKAAAAAQRERTGQLEQTLHAQLASIEQALRDAAAEKQGSEADAASKLAAIKSEEQRLSAQNADVARHRDDLAGLR